MVTTRAIDRHEVALQAPSFLGGAGAPALLRRTDQDFVNGLFRDLKMREGGDDRLAPQQLPIERDGEAVLYQPVHRCFNLALLDASCKVPGGPRLDPAKILEAGLVVRRRLPDPETGVLGPPERWMKQEGKVIGWLPPLDAGELDEDPEGKHRPRPRQRNPVIQRRLEDRRLARFAKDGPPLDEVVDRLYVAPPDICERTGRTLLFGLVPTTDPEVSDRGGKLESSNLMSGVEKGKDNIVPGDAFDEAGLEEVARDGVIPAWLLGNARTPRPPRLSGRSLRVVNHGTADRLVPEVEIWCSNHGWQRFQDELGFPVPDLTSKAPGGHGQAVYQLMQQVWSMQALFRTFDEDRVLPGTPEPRASLEQVELELGEHATVNLYTYLEGAYKVLVLREVGATLTVPTGRKTLDRDLATRMKRVLITQLNLQLRRFARSNEPRFSRHDARYEIRAFLRVRREDGCPPVLVWSKPTEPFRIARWFEPGPEDAPVPEVELPGLSRDFLKSVKPNVTFKVPRSLFNFLKNNVPGDLVEGKGNNDQDGPAFQWICGFNIPIITLCAFIVLFIFLSLLNIIFWWLPFVRICIPLPTSATSSFSTK